MIYAVVDTESTNSSPSHVFDFAIILYCTRKKAVIFKFACIVYEYRSEPLFHLDDNSFFSRASLARRTANYSSLFKAGHRMLANTASINRLLVDLDEMYKPVLTCYNLAFDTKLCYNSGIELPFTEKFCLWHSAVMLFGCKKAYRKFCLKNKYLTGKLTIQTSAEVMYKYLSKCVLDYKEEHTALEDCYIELEILKHCIARKQGGWRKAGLGYNWRDHSLPKVLNDLGIEL